MRFARLSAVAATLAATSAFLVPTEISDSDIDIIKSLPFEDAVGIDTRVVELRCANCPVFSNIEGKMHAAQTGVESMLQLNFNVEHDDGRDKLMLNGMQIYPLDPRSSTFLEPLTAQQMVKGKDDAWTYAATPKLGYSLSIKHPTAYSKDSVLDVVSIHVEIVEVADKFLSGLPTVNIKVLETSSHKLMIGAAEVIAPKSQVAKPTDGGQECTTLICKWRAIIVDRLSKLQGLKKGGCGKSKGHSRPVEFAKPKHHGHHEAEGKHHGHHGEHNRPHTHGSDGAHRAFRHHHRHGGIARFLRGVVMHIFIPVLIGIMVGITASLIGMVVGHIAIFLWRITFRRGQRGQCNKYPKVEQAEATETTDDEDKSFLAHQGPPPVYEVVVKDEKTEEI